MTWLYLGARDDLAAELERCNADKLAAVVEAEKVAREATEAAMAVRIAELARQAALERSAREIAERARAEAEARPERVRTVIRRVADVDACISADVPRAVIDSLRD